MVPNLVSLAEFLRANRVGHYGYETVRYYIGEITGTDSEMETIIKKSVFTKGRNLLHIACSTTNIQLAQFCLKIGISITVCDTRGHNCLHYALLSKSTYATWRVSLIKYLLLNGADYNKQDHTGRSPLDILGKCQRFSGDENTEIQECIDLLQLR